MNARVFSVAAALSLVGSLAGCSKDEGHDPTPPPPQLSLTAARTSVVANGANTVALSVTDTGGGPVTLTTTRGSFGDAQTTTVPGASGTATLVTCDAAADTSCAGTAVVTATSATGSTSTSITFAALATACRTNCRVDAGCANLACNLSGGGTGACSATALSSCLASTTCTPSPAGSTLETSCTDQVDNDCNGSVDCADAACSTNAACAASTSGLALTLTPGRTRLPADGAATTTVVAEVRSDGAPAAGHSVTFARTLGALSATTATTGADGRATVTFTAAATAGVATITASLTQQPAVSRQATITLPRLGAFRLPDAPLELAVMGARDSGWNEVGAIQVQVLDDQGLPYPDGLAVRFEHRALGGSTLNAPLATANLGACTAAAGCVAFDSAISSGGDAPNSAGLATAWLHSGTVAGTLAVTATATAGGVTRTVALPTATVIGAKASGGNFAIVCAPRNVPALAETDCAISLVDAPITCAAILKDRYNNLLGTASQVVFASEAAAVGQIATTPAYAPGSDPTAQADLGIATQIFNTLGAGLPFDVDPDTAAGEGSVDHGLDGCGLRTHNPRDGVVTIVAIADGEEAFFDANGNGAHDASEPFVDQGEPFVDEDDDGVHTPGEWFLDVDGNRAYTPGNVTWDASAKIWTQTVIVYSGTGTPALATGAGTFLGTRWAAGAVDACTATVAAPNFAVNAAVAGPPPVAPTTQTYTVVASDMNLNFLSSGTTYAVAVKNDAKVVPDYRGLASYADGVGFFYQYWPCDQAGNCASQCRAAAADLPCEMRPTLASYRCGVGATVLVRGGDEPDAGTVELEWSVDVPWNVFGAAKVHRSAATLRGTNN